MHPDRKIGIAMGILLVGVVAALFFRNEPLVIDDGLTLRREVELNQRLQDRDVTIFVNEKVSAESTRSEDDLPDWSLSEMFHELKAKDAPSPTPIGSVSPLSKRQQPKSEDDSVQHSGSLADKHDAESPPTFSIVDEGLEDSTAAEAEEAAEFTEYTVKFGDTLSEISQRFLGSQGRYKEIYEANKDRMANPDQLRVGKAIRIPRVLR